MICRLVIAGGSHQPEITSISILCKLYYHYFGHLLNLTCTVNYVPSPGAFSSGKVDVRLIQDNVLQQLLLKYF